MSGSVYVGTSGWYYKEWQKTFYPAGAAKNQLSYYATQFPSVEINSSFYRLLKENAVRTWLTQVPSEFVFAIKGSRFITHMKKLRSLNGGLDRFFTTVRWFGNRAGPILWQLPPILKKDLARLDDFLTLLPAGYRYAVEFRHPSWIDDDVFELLNKRGAAVVWLSSQAMPQDFTVTADFIFTRFHGLEGGPRHDYTGPELQPWARQIKKQARAGRDAFVYFNNDLNVRAPYNAQLLMDMIGKAAVRVSKVPAEAGTVAPRKRSSAREGPKKQRD